MKKNKLFKKFGVIFGVLGVVTIGVIGTSLVKASENDPNMSIEVLVKDNKDTINTFVNQEFTVDVKVNPDKIKYESANTATVIRGSKLVLESQDFEIVSSTVGTIEKNSVNLGEFKYTYDGMGFNTGTPFDVTLKVRALKEGSYNASKSFNKLIKLHHKNASGNDAKAKVDDVDNKLNVIVDKVDYKNPKIVGGGFLPNKEVNEKGNKVVAFGELLELNYHLVPSEITKAEKPQNGEGDSSRKLIYVLDESTLSKSTEGSQSSKEALVKSLNDLKATNPKQEVALVTYGSKAKVVKSSEKSFYTIDELIKNINEISSDEINGNLGDALRQAQYLINENKDAKISVILVSEGNPAYYIKKDDSNNLVEFSTKTGELGTHFEYGKEYVEEIAELINKENEKNKRDIRWFNINYGLEEEKVISNEVIKALGGETENEAMPTELDFEKATKNATSDLVVNMEIKAEGNGKVKVAPESNKQVISVHYNYGEDGKTLVPVTKEVIGEGENGKKTIPFKIGVKFVSATELDLANPEILKVSVNSNMEGSEEVVFNVLENAEGSETVSWKAEPQVNYLKVTGLHNGKLDNFQVARDGNYDVESLEYMQTIASQIFDGINGSEFPMAKENTFRNGALIKVSAESKIELNIKDIKGKSNIRENGVSWEVYEYSIEESKFVKLATKAYKDVKILEPNKLYLVITDCFIPDDAEVNASFNIGYKLTVREDVVNEAPATIDPALNGGVEIPDTEPSVEEAQLPGSSEVVQEENLYNKYFREERTVDSTEKAIEPVEIEAKIIIKDKPNHY